MIWRRKNRYTKPKPSPRAKRPKAAKPAKAKPAPKPKAPPKPKREPKPPRAAKPPKEPKAKLKREPKPKTQREPKPKREPRPRPTPPVRSWDTRQIIYVLALAAVCLALFMSFPGLRSMWETDEARYAEIPREMLALHDWVTPHLNYVKYFEKPPLTYWLVAVGYQLFGVSGAVARLVPGLAGTAVVLLVFLLGRAMWTARAGFFAGLTLATMAMFFGLSRILMTDMVLCLGVVMAIYGAWSTREGQRWGPYVFWVGCAVGFLSKGLLGPGLPIMAVVIFAALGLETGMVRRLADWRAILVFVALCAPWIILVSIRNPGYFYYFFIGENLGRLLTAQHQRYEPPWFYFALFPGATFPWVALIPWAVWRTWPGKAWRGVENRAWLLAAVWFVSFFVFLSLANSKMIHYLLPALPALALLLGRGLEIAGEAGWRQWAPPGLRAGLTATALVALAAGLALVVIPAVNPDISFGQAGSALFLGPLMAALLAGAVFAARKHLWAALAAPLAIFALMAVGAGLVAPRLDDWRSVEKLTQEAVSAMDPDDLWVNYGDYYHGSVFYSRRRVAVVQNWGELDHGRGLAGNPQKWFIPGDEAFIKLLQDPKHRVVAIAETDSFHRLRAKTRNVPGVLLMEWARVGDKSLFSNLPR